MSAMSEAANWQPSAPISNLLKRADMIKKIRQFFTDRGVLEVDTPCMSQATVTDVHLSTFETRFLAPTMGKSLSLYMTTSPEYHMKRLLAAGSGPIYQMGRCFRNEEMGRYHNPEFTLLEWYRPHYDMYRLMDEVDDLLQQILTCDSAETLSYQQAFLRHLNIDPLSADETQIKEAAVKLNLASITDNEKDRDYFFAIVFLWLELSLILGVINLSLFIIFLLLKPPWQASVLKIIELQSVLRCISKGLN